MRRRTTVMLAVGLALAATPLAADARNGARADIYGDPIALGLFNAGLSAGSTGLPARLGESTPTRADGGATDGQAPLRVYVVVVDGMRPQQVGPQTPALDELRTSGTWYEQARSVLPAETLPNHAAMATGVLPERNGIVANQMYRGENGKEYMQYPEFWDADTIVTRLERAYRGNIATATILSKEYLYGLFRGEHAGPADRLAQIEADFHWDPRTQPAYVTYPSSHGLDAGTMGTFLDWIRAQEGSELPQFALVNLGDVDRAGHADESGVAPAAAERAAHPGDDELSAATVAGFQQAAIEDTDTQIRLLVKELKDTGAWDETVLIVLSDHGMDWSPQSNTVNAYGTLTGAGYKTTVNQGGDVSDFQIVGGGSTELVYVNSRQDIAPMARLLCAIDGVSVLATRTPISGLDPSRCRNRTLHELGIDHRYSPDIELFLDPGWHSAPVTPDSNPLPGNHGSGVTQHSILMVAGGAPVLRPAGSVPGETVYHQGDVAAPAGPGVLSIAPTVAGLFGIGAPHGGYDADPLTAAFAPGAVDLATSDPLPAPAPGGQEDDGTDPEPPAGGGAPLLTTGARVEHASLTQATYLLQVANRGSATASGVVLTNPVPEHTSFAGAARSPLDPACTVGSPAGTGCRWSVGDLGPGDSATVRVSYDLLPADATYAVANRVTAQLAGADPASGDPSITESSLSYSVLALKDAHVDRAAPANTNYGVCDHLELARDNAVTAFLDADGAFPKEAGASPEYSHVWAARLQATVATLGAPVAVGAHPIVSHDWTEGTGTCAGVTDPTRFGGEHDARTPGPADAVPVSGDAVDTSTASAVGQRVTWDVAAAVDTHEERFAFNGFELRLAEAGGSIGFHATQAAAAAARPRLVTVTTRPESSVSCVDADPDTRSVASGATVRLRAYATFAPGTKVTNSAGDDACTGFPAPGVGVGWEFDDDDPDAYLTSLAGVPVERETGSHGDAAPNRGSTVTGPSGRTFVDLRLGDPATAGTTRTAAFLIKKHDGYNAPPYSATANDCEPGEPGVYGVTNIPGIPLILGCAGTGESAAEDDVSISWAPAG